MWETFEPLAGVIDQTLAIKLAKTIHQTVFELALEDSLLD